MTSLDPIFPRATPIPTQRKALDISTALEDAHLRALAQYAETWLFAREGQWSAALEILEDIVPVLRGLGDWDMAIRANRTRAWMYEELGDMASFWAITEANLDFVRFALISVRTGKPFIAAQLLARATALRDEIGFALESWMTEETEEALAAMRAHLDEETFAEAWEAGSKMSLNEAVALALDPASDYPQMRAE